MCILGLSNYLRRPQRPPKVRLNLGCRGHEFPFRHRIVAESSKSVSGDEMALDVEYIVDGSMDGEESLGRFL